MHKELGARSSYADGIPGDRGRDTAETTDQTIESIKISIAQIDDIYQQFANSQSVYRGPIRGLLAAASTMLRGEKEALRAPGMLRSAVPNLDETSRELIVQALKDLGIEVRDLAEDSKS